MLSVSPSSITRSSLEEMLEALWRREENEKPKDTPPALPARPKPPSRARLPSTKRRLPTVFEAELGQESSNCNVKKEEINGVRGNMFGVKKVKAMEPGESPYGIVGSDVKEQERDNYVENFPKEKHHVWCPLRDGQWELGQVKSSSEERAAVQLSDGSVATVSTEDLLPANPGILEGVDDLIQLSYLNEPSVLHNLEYRYSQGIIYSKAGPVLVAVNPFKNVELYGNEFVTAYKERLLDSPHVFAVTDMAYDEMTTEEKNQSIILSGESGSGKTETAKAALLYLAAVGGGGDGLESKILQTSCILEAFGNAKTTKNDNASRFGKLTAIHFNATGKICGATIQTFLLEKSRVVQLAQGERSYHIFYQLCSGAPSDLREKLRLKRASEYNYLNQSDCLEIHNVDDSQKFHMLMGALNTVRICKEDQDCAFEMLAAVLWLGNISFLVTDNVKHIEVVADEAVSNAASLIGCSEQDLMLALSTRKIQVGKDKITKRLTLQQAIETRDTLAKFIYTSLFDWLVEKINSLLAVGKHNSGRSITIVDIYGFESFKKNSFEQFCINYANERLQQHFNRHLFKLEQTEYELDGIDWTKVDFEDNQDRLDLFEKIPTGLISLLDEELNHRKATDLTFATKLKQHLNANPCFKGELGGAFRVQHYAGEVLYDTVDFLEKNRDTLHSESIQLLSSCTGQLPQYFASTLLQRNIKQSVATRFKGQLFKFMQQLESTTPHFIRCIKPNNKQIPGVFEKDLVLKQLRYCGVAEVVRISRCGYPTRMTHQEFARRYGFLLGENNGYQDPLSMSVAILQQFDILPEMYQVGYTKLYFRAGQIDALEEIRKQVLQGTLEVQKCFRGHRARRHFHELKGAVTTFQSYVRGEIARNECGALRLKSQVAHEKLDEQLMATVQIQSVIRGWLVRRHFSHLRNSRKSNVCKWKPVRRISEVKDLPPELLPSVVEELQKRVLMAEATLGHKEKENADLREQVQQLEARWPENEAKMKSMEEMWQKQIASLQMSLAAAKKSLGADGALSPRSYDSDTSMGTQTPGGSTPIRVLNHSSVGTTPCRDTISGLDPISPLEKEFERRRQHFDDEALAIVEVKPGRHSPVNPVEEFRRLKQRFELWKKDYKIRLREAKTKVRKLGQNEPEKRRKWWGMKK